MSGQSAQRPRLDEEQLATLTSTFAGNLRGDMAEMVQQLYWALLATARRHMAQERPGHTLSPTALVNEAWLRLDAGFTQVPENRRQFMAIAARLMRQVLIDHARTRQRDKRGGGVVLDTWTDSLAVAGESDFVELLQVDTLLEELERLNPSHCRIVECRFFGGLTIEETAEALDLSVGSVNRGWRLARAWRAAYLAGGGVDAAAT